MYFNEFDKILYDLPTKNGDTTLRVLTDITTNVRIRKEVLENITLYDEYDLKDGETPEIVAEQYYGNPELHWVIMLVNQRYDYLRDFPLTTEELHNYSISKYGEDGLDQIHHYEKDGIVVQAQGLLKLNPEIYEVVKPNDIFQNDFLFGKILSKSTGVSGQFAQVLIERGKFVTGQALSIFGIRLNEVSRKSEYTGIVTYTIPSNSFTLSPGYEAITNYSHEEKVNEKKRRIKLISPQLITQIVKEFRDLV